LAANTAFADFPRLASILARDGYVPRAFRSRGDRLAFTVGIVSLATLSSLLLIVFGGSLDHLIPLYAIGVFLSFTLSQSGMVVHWVRQRGPNWQRSTVVNGVGAVVTGIVTFVIVITKFKHGAWLILILIPLLILGFKAIHGHYARATEELEAQTPLESDAIVHAILVPIAAVNRVARQTLAYARSISDDVIAVHVADEEAAVAAMRTAWNELGTDVQLVIIESPYRSVAGPLMRYLDEIQRQRPGATLTVVLPEFVASHWWEQLLHNQTALRLKAALLFRPGTVVVSVPSHLARGGRAEASAP
ncbi:MAG: amino acid permease, partial [Thermomicrobiales bacterium]